MQTTSNKPPYPSFWQAFFYWLKLGFISFGGPAGQIAMMHQELVEKRRWISEQRFLHALNYCMLLPGPEAQQLAIYLGWLLHRTAGGIVAGILFVLPSLLILCVLTYVYLQYGNLSVVQGVFNGLKPAVVAIVLFAAWRIGNRALKNPLLWGFAIASFLALFALHIPFPLLIVLAGVGGYIGGQWRPDLFALNTHSTQAKQFYGEALLDEHTPPAAHTRFSLPRLLILLASFLAIWLMAIWLLPTGILRDMGLFFSKMAMVTFGGAYAALPYIYQQAVEQYGWLSGPQMIDGLALGETTPGPLIMVVAFVGYVGGWSQALLGSDALGSSGMIAAMVVTFFTFLPSFLFILAGAPLIESTHNNLRFTAPLTGITAAVVGVILNLAVFFGWHVLWPAGTDTEPFAGGLHLTNTLLASAALLALWRWKMDIVPVLGACAGIGLLLQGFS